MRSLGKKKGYRFLGTTLAGNDAFFIREDYAGRFESALLSNVALPSKFCDSRNAAGELSFLRGVERLKQIEHLPVVNTETGEVQMLKSLDPVYSKEWFERIS